MHFFQFCRRYQLFCTLFNDKFFLAQLYLVFFFILDISFWDLLSELGSKSISTLSTSDVEDSTVDVDGSMADVECVYKCECVAFQDDIYPVSL